MTHTAFVNELFSDQKDVPVDILFANSITPMMVVDEDRAIVVVNKQFCALFGYEATEVIGQKTSLLTPSLSHFEAYREHFERTRDGSIKSSELQYKKKNGALFWVKLTGVSLPTENQNYIIWSFDDISKEVQAREELNARYTELDIIFNKVPTGLAYVVDGTVERANPALFKMLDRAEEDIVGQDVQTLIRAYDADWAASGKRLIASKANSDACPSTDLSLELETEAVSGNSTLMIFHDVTHHVQEKDVLQSKADTDWLTGLLNRGAFWQKAQTLLDAPETTDVSFIALDVDHFKTTNDSFGHSVGDTVLVELADFFRDELRKDELLGRIGGEEFAVVLPVAQASAIAICERIVRHVKERSFTDKQLNITISAGVADSNFSRQLDALYQEADRLLYRAKRLGRDRVEFDVV